MLYNCSQFQFSNTDLKTLLSLLLRPLRLSHAEEHAKEIQETHLKDLIINEERCEEMHVVEDGIMLDYSRQRVTEKVSCVV